MPASEPTVPPTLSVGDLRRIAVVNRGEAAMRAINAMRELRHELGIDLVSIALHTEAERRAMFVREADEAVVLAPSDTAASPYLDLAVLEAALVEAEADAVWVGWGFVAERAEFAELCDRLGVVFMGPRPDVMRRLGDKIGAKLLAEEAGVPVAPWSGGPVDDLVAAVEQAERIGYPLMIKATAGGGGRGIRRVDRAEDLAAAFDSARSEGAKAFGDPTVFMERVVEQARHVEVQLLGDSHGGMWALGIRDCSLQRRNQKVIEESGCVALSSEQAANLGAAAVRLGRLAGYTNAGTVEFLYRPATEEFAFLEVNTRLQVEHPVTELTTGTDIVKWQLHVAAGGALPTADPPPSAGVALEARLNAEDPAQGFTPSTGTISTLRLPAGAGIRVDTGVAEGDVIPPQYDSMIAKIIAVGSSRPEALARLQRAIEQTVVVVDGGLTNKSFLLGLLDRPEVRRGDVTTAWLDEVTARGDHVSTAGDDIALVAAALVLAERERAYEEQEFFHLASRGRPVAPTGCGREVELRRGTATARLHVAGTAPDRFRVSAEGAIVDVAVEPLGGSRTRLIIGGHRHTVTLSGGGDDDTGDLLVEVDGVAHRFSRDDAGVVRAPATVLVVGTPVAVGDLVAAGDRVMVVEAMKMEVALTAPVAGRVVDVLVTRNTQVEAGTPLLRIEPLEGPGHAADPGAGGDTSVPSLDRLAGWSDHTAADPQATLIWELLGYDLTGADAAAARARLRGDDDLAVLGVYADVCALTPERRTPGPGADAGPPEWFRSYLRTLDVDAEGLPPAFVERLERALAHYGVTSLQPTPRLRRALLHLTTAHQREHQHVRTVVGLLEDRLARRDQPDASPELRDTLDRLIEATQRRHPAISSLARAVRYRSFDRPAIDEHQAAVSASMRRHVDVLLSDAPDPAAERTAADALVACPLPVLALITADGRFATIADPSPVLAVLTRRYYKIRRLHGLGHETVDGYAVVRTAYEHRNRAVTIFAVRSGSNNLGGALAATAEAASRTELPGTAVVDLYLAADPSDDRDLDDIASSVVATLDDADLPARVRRVAVIVARPGAVSVPLTFRRADDGEVLPYWMLDHTTDDENVQPHRFREDVTFRGLHPMIARRLHMWRLSNFEITRLPSNDDVYAFDCVARDVPSDERLIAVAEVRDATPVRDDDRRVVAVPGFEHMLVGCLDALRRTLAERRDRARLVWNRVLLHVWPVVDVSLDDVQEIVHRLAPLTDGLGIEQVIVNLRLRNFPSGDSQGEPGEIALRLGFEPGRGLTLRYTEPPAAPMQPLDDYTRKRIQSRRRGLVYPYDLVAMAAGTAGTFVEYDLDESDAAGPAGSDRLVPVTRAPGANSAAVVVGVVTTPSRAHPAGITRVIAMGDPTKAMGAITEAECRRLLAAIDLADERGLPIDWFALSAGAKIAMDSGSENLDWVARVLRRIVEHTQRGGQINVVVAGINVGAQPYWNAEATMLMHTSGILIMTPDSAMVLTGKQAIDYSGGVSAEDNLGIGGYSRVMGPNGEAQYFASNLGAACELLLDHHALTYRSPGQAHVPRSTTTDPIARDVRLSPHPVDVGGFATVGDVISAEHNPDRKKPFDIRAVMTAVGDADSPVLERWAGMAEAENAVVWDTRLGGYTVSLIGVESRPLPRHGITPADGPAQWSAGTLFPLSSKKVARAINAASGRRPVVVLANLSGFDGSPESLRRLQLEYGAEIGRAIVNFDGPIVLCVVSRYHGGAFVVFSATLNDRMEVLAVEGSFASVIGGAPAAAVVFTREVDARTANDSRVRELEAAVAAAAPGGETAMRRAELAHVRELVRAEMLGAVAAEFDAIHSVERARSVGSVDRIITAADLRPELIAAVERGLFPPTGRLTPPKG